MITMETMDRGRRGEAESPEGRRSCRRFRFNHGVFSSFVTLIRQFKLFTQTLFKIFRNNILSVTSVFLVFVWSFPHFIAGSLSTVVSVFVFFLATRGNSRSCDPW